MTLVYVVADKNGGTSVEMTPDEESAFISNQSIAQNVAIAMELVSQAQSYLDRSDLVATRCFKAGVPFPSEWQSYVTSLRAIVSSGTGVIPTQPSYPAGT